MTKGQDITAEATTATSTSGRVRLRRAREFCRRFWVPLVLVFAALLSCSVVTISHPPEFSPLDEWVYYDYMTKVPTQLVVRQGEEIGEPALAGMACFGDSFGARGEPCTGLDGTYDEPNLYPQTGLTTADIYTPFYFAPSWAVGSIIEVITPLPLLTSYRLTGFFWLSGGLVVFCMLARRFRVPEVVTAALGLIVIGLPSSQLAYTFITTDAPSFLLGSVVLLSAIRYMDGRWKSWPFLVAAAIAVLFKVTNIFSVGAAVVALLALAVFNKPINGLVSRRPSRMVLVALASVLAVAIAEGMWLVIRSMIKVGNSPVLDIDEPLSLGGIAEQLTTFIRVPDPGSFDGLRTLPYALLLIVGTIGFAASVTGREVDRALGIAAGISATLFAPALLVVLTIAFGSAFPVIPRYNLSLLPLFLLGIGLMLKNDSIKWLTVGYAVILFGSTLADAILP